MQKWVIYNYNLCLYGVMDSTMVFGTISSGSNPDRDAKKRMNSHYRILTGTRAALNLK